MAPLFFDFWNIDIEGQSVDIMRVCLEELGFTPPELICVEFDDRKADVQSLCERYRYQIIHQTDENLVCRRSA